MKGERQKNIYNMMSSFDMCYEGKGDDIRSDESCVCVHTCVWGHMLLLQEGCLGGTT